jgi:hypothetical protein
MYRDNSSKSSEIGSVEGQQMVNVMNFKGGCNMSVMHLNALHIVFHQQSAPDFIDCGIFGKQGHFRFDSLQVALDKGCREA